MNLEDAVSALESRPAAYVLQSAAGSYRYKGSCRDLVKRQKDHLAGREWLTRRYGGNR